MNISSKIHSIKYLLHIIFLLFVIISVQNLYSQNIEEQIKENNYKASVYLSEGKKNAAAQLYSQSAYLLRNAGRLNEAADYYKKVLDINTDLGNSRGQMTSHNSIAMVYLEAENYSNAVLHLEKELQFRKQINNKAEIINVLANLALAQNELSKFESAIENIEQAISLSKELNDFTLLKRCYGVAYDIYYKQGNDTKSKEYYELYSTIDRRLKEQKMEEITDEAKRIVTEAHTEKELTQQELTKTSKELEETVTTLHKVEKITHEQQMEIDLKEAKINEQNALLKAERIRRRYLMTGIIALTLFVLVLTFMIFKIRNANKKINQQRLWLEKQNKEIRASIRYAQTIQQAMLPAAKEIEKYFEPFIIYLPKDIVSGDFYWISTLRNGSERPTIYFSVVDCTGHGVPGAFMSMIGNRLLNEIVNEKKQSSPSEILSSLNILIREALRQEETDNNDGMDMSLCKFENKGNNKYKLVYSGAKRPLYVIKNNENKLITHRGDRKSIGGYSLSKREIKFTNYEIDVESGDMIYLFSDGIIDQNGPDRKKFGRLRLEEALIDCAKLRPIEQKAIVLQRLKDYMQNEDQRDDITLVGLKII
ncbi:MAG: SpoIIE family protein phosphatase [Bacteroidales bacterium]|nr:SpoIIE family protein phosphatase [Bacteroidales bacterium]